MMKRYFFHPIQAGLLLIFLGSGLLSALAESPMSDPVQIQVQVWHFIAPEGNEKLAGLADGQKPIDKDALLREVGAIENLEVLGGPTVTMKNRKRAVIRLIRQVELPEKFSPAEDGNLKLSKTVERDLGLEIEFEPEWQNGKIILNGLYCLTELEGTMQSEPGVQTSMLVKREAYFCLRLENGEARLLAVRESADARELPKQFFLITARLAVDEA